MTPPIHAQRQPDRRASLSRRSHWRGVHLDMPCSGKEERSSQERGAVLLRDSGVGVRSLPPHRECDTLPWGPNPDWKRPLIGGGLYDMRTFQT